MNSDKEAGRYACNTVLEHRFFEVSKLKEAQDGTWLEGIRVVCAICGQIRHIWQDGTVRVVE